jgi:hypothetical protein
MDKDSMALFKFAIAVAIIAILLIVWFKTVGAPGGDEEEDAAVIIETMAGCLSSKMTGLIPVF